MFKAAKRRTRLMRQRIDLHTARMDSRRRCDPVRTCIFYFAYDRLCQVGRRFLPGFYSEEGLRAFIDFVRAG